MAFNFLNKHIISKIRNILNDKSDSKYSLEDKVEICNSGLNTYSKYIFNYKNKTLQINPDGNSYDLPKNCYSLISCIYSNTLYELKENEDYKIEDGKIKLISFGKLVYNQSSDLNIFYDSIYEELQIDNVGDLIIGENVIEITKSFDLGEFILVGDGINEEVVKITSKTGNFITFNLTKNYTDGYLIGNAKIDEVNFDILASYSKYYDKSVTGGQFQKMKWTQGERSQEIDYGNNDSGTSFDKSLQGFIDMLKSDKNYKFREFQGFDSVSFYKS